MCIENRGKSLTIEAGKRIGLDKFAANLQYAWALLNKLAR